MKADDKTARASIDVKHLDPAFYLKGIEQVIDPVIKGLKTEVKITKAGAYVYLKSEMQVTRLEKRKTIRAVWWNGKHDLPLTTKELLQVKIKADQWYSDNKAKSDYKLIYLSELLDGYIQDPSVTEGTRKGRKNCLFPLQEKFSKIEINDITSDLLLRLQDDLLSWEKWGNDSKRIALIRLSQFMAYAFKKTKNKNISVALTEFNLLKEKIKKDQNHFRTLESTNNVILRSELVKAIQRILTSRTQYKKNLLAFLYIPLRISEVLGITGADVTKENIFIPKTKTIKESQGGFNVPINDKVYRIVTENLSQGTAKRQVMSRLFAKLTGFTVHGIRSLFSDYMTREGFQWNLIESCLSHKTSNTVEECYHRDQKNYFYEQRKPLMFHWYDFISGCISEAERLIGQESQG
jgi:integrase